MLSERAWQTRRADRVFVERHIMTSCRKCLLASAALLIAGFVQPAAAQSGQIAHADLKDAKGKAVGTVDLTQTAAGVLIRLDLKGMPTGEHAIHVHMVGKCEAPFESAGAHFNPTNQKHGMMAGAGHAGDMPNLHIPQSGDLMAEIVNVNVTLDKGKPNSLFDNDGSSLVIHAAA